jgi:hypothetical protein
MSRYRRIAVRMWLDAAFCALSVEEKLVALYLLSGPATNCLGLFPLSPAAAAEHFNWSVPVFRRRLDTVCQALGWRFDPVVRVLWIPSWVGENPPQNPNVVRAFATAFDEIPDCGLKAEAAAALRAALVERGESFVKTFAESFRQPFVQPARNGSGNAPVPVPEEVMVRRSNRGGHETVVQTRLMVDRLHARRAAGGRS